MADINRYKLGTLAQIPAGEGRVFNAGDIEVAVFHDRSGKIFATQSHCPHAQGSLADGLVGSGTVICPLHERAYNLTTGECNNCTEQLTTYAVELNELGEIVLST